VDVLIDGEDVDFYCVDVTIVSPLTVTKAKHPEGQICGKLIATAAHRKIGKHQEDCVRTGIEFLPFAIDVFWLNDIPFGKGAHTVCRSHYSDAS
jgi:hypothetical protein